MATIEEINYKILRKFIKLDEITNVFGSLDKLLVELNKKIKLIDAKLNLAAMETIGTFEVLADGESSINYTTARENEECLKKSLDILRNKYRIVNVVYDFYRPIYNALYMAMPANNKITLSMFHDLNFLRLTRVYNDLGATIISDSYYTFSVKTTTPIQPYQLFNKYIMSVVK
jgi:hypothetical protein